MDSNLKQKPVVCVIDEDPLVKKGWEISLGPDAQLYYFSSHHELLEVAESDKQLIPSFSCIIFGRYFKTLNMDIVTSSVTDTLKAAGAGPILLNWQGYVTKDEVNAKFDGKLFHRYGVKWQTLRLRIQRFEKTQRQTKKIFPSKEFKVVEKQRRHVSSISQPDKCGEILKCMARKAVGPHKEKIEFYAYHDRKGGVKLLEAIYNRLLTDKNRPDSCPSHYINSSPVIAQRILREALYS